MLKQLAVKLVLGGMLASTLGTGLASAATPGNFSGNNWGQNNNWGQHNNWGDHDGHDGHHHGHHHHHHHHHHGHHHRW